MHGSILSKKDFSMDKTRSQEVKTFHDLINEVQKPGFCGKCGGCVCFCSADNLGALKTDRNGMPVFADEDKCLACGICYMICPNTYDLDSDLEDRFGWKPPIGPVLGLKSARTTDAVVRQNCTDGGVVTSLLLYLLDKGMIEAALVSKSRGPFQRGPLLATTREEIISAAGSHFDESFSVVELGSRYSTYSPAMYALKRLRGTATDRIAMVGTPCQIRTVRKMQVLGIIPADIIKYCFGLFCWENFSFNDLEKDQLGKQYDFDTDRVVKVNVKEDFSASLKDGRVVHIPFEVIDALARPACLVCPDFSAEYSDFSFGGLGSSDGYTTVLIRSETGRDVYSKAVADRYIEEKQYPSTQKARSDRTKLKAMVVGFSQKKRARAFRNFRKAKSAGL
jgi:coenzyme F420 hydrogenase subunit beta